MLSMAWTPRSRFRPPQRTLSTQDTTPGRATGSNIWVGATTDKRYGLNSQMNYNNMKTCLLNQRTFYQMALIKINEREGDKS